MICKCPIMSKAIITCFFCVIQVALNDGMGSWIEVLNPAGTISTSKANLQNIAILRTEKCFLQLVLGFLQSSYDLTDRCGIVL